MITIASGHEPGILVPWGWGDVNPSKALILCTPHCTSQPMAIYSDDPHGFGGGSGF